MLLNRGFLLVVPARPTDGGIITTSYLFGDANPSFPHIDARNAGKDE